MAGDKAASEWQSRLEAVAKAIEGYVTAHPNAIDSASGVRAWWLGELEGPMPEEVVQAALDQLCAAGTLEARKVPGGFIYGRPLGSGR